MLELQPLKMAKILGSFVHIYVRICMPSLSSTPNIYLKHLCLNFSLERSLLLLLLTSISRTSLPEGLYSSSRNRNF